MPEAAPEPRILCCMDFWSDVAEKHLSLYKAILN